MGKEKIAKQLLSFEEEVFDPWYIKRVVRDLCVDSSLPDGIAYTIKLLFVDLETLEFRYPSEQAREEQYCVLLEKMGKCGIIIMDGGDLEDPNE